MLLQPATREQSRYIVRTLHISHVPRVFKACSNCGLRVTECTSEYKKVVQIQCTISPEASSYSIRMLTQRFDFVISFAEDCNCDNTRIDHLINFYWSGSHSLVFLDHSGCLTALCTTFTFSFVWILKERTALGNVSTFCQKPISHWPLTLFCPALIIPVQFVEKRGSTQGENKSKLVILKKVVWSFYCKINIKKPALAPPLKELIHPLD